MFLFAHNVVLSTADLACMSQSGWPSFGLDSSMQFMIDHRGRHAKIFGWAKSATDLSMTDVRWRKSRNI